MLRMGFIEDVEWILSQAPDERQTALFSATMPPEIRRIAAAPPAQPGRDRHRAQDHHRARHRAALSDASRRSRSWTRSPASWRPSRPRRCSSSPAPRTARPSSPRSSQARGYAAEAMHGDMNQAQRETRHPPPARRQVEIVVATDVAARGLDVERISHVINYDIPNDVEAYVHRIGRTGRAGRSGVAVLFVSPRERRMMQDIERFTGQRIQPMKMPTQADVAARRMRAVQGQHPQDAGEGDLELYLTLVEELVEEGLDIAEIAAAAARLARGDKPLEVAVEPAARDVSPAPRTAWCACSSPAGSRAGVRPADIVGAIANEAGVPGKAIGAIDIYDDFTFVELPPAVPRRRCSRGWQAPPSAAGRWRSAWRRPAVRLRIAAAGPVRPTATRDQEARPGGTAGRSRLFGDKTAAVRLRAGKTTSARSPLPAAAPGPRDRRAPRSRRPSRSPRRRRRPARDRPRPGWQTSSVTPGAGQTESAAETLDGEVAGVERRRGSAPPPSRTACRLQPPPRPPAEGVEDGELRGCAASQRPATRARRGCAHRGCRAPRRAAGRSRRSAAGRAGAGARWRGRDAARWRGAARSGGAARSPPRLGRCQPRR